MNMPQIIKSENGKPEFALIPFAVYHRLKEMIEQAMAAHEGDYIPFRAEEYVSNPVALARIRARTTQQQLAKKMGVSQAYISKIETQSKVTAKLLEKVNAALAEIQTGAKGKKR
jgi:DNA-binding XRE family transcriptional regulator